MVKCAWLIFIRSSSKRLPGKALMKIGGLVMLEHIVSNLRFDGVSEEDMFLCTSNSQSDDKIAEIGASLGIKVIRGSEREPIERYWEHRLIWKEYDYVSRVNGDSPLYVAHLGLTALGEAEDRLICPDVISNIRGGKRFYPSGLSLEMYKTAHLNQLLQEHTHYRRYEHMSVLIELSQKEGGLILDVMPRDSLPAECNRKLTVDTIDDYKCMCNMACSGLFQEILKYYRKAQLVVRPVK